MDISPWKVVCEWLDTCISVLLDYNAVDIRKYISPQYQRLDHMHPMPHQVQGSQLGHQKIGVYEEENRSQGHLGVMYTCQRISISDIYARIYVLWTPIIHNAC